MKREILFCNITALENKKEIIIKNVVLLEDEFIYKNKKYKEPLKIIKREIIKSLGFENKTNGYVNAIKSNEKRNEITGAYD